MLKKWLDVIKKLSSILNILVIKFITAEFLYLLQYITVYTITPKVLLTVKG